MRNNRNCDMFKFFGKDDILEWHRRSFPLKNPTRPVKNIAKAKCKCCKAEIPVGALCSTLKVAGKSGCVICGKCADIIYEEMKIIDGEVPF